MRGGYRSARGPLVIMVLPHDIPPDYPERIRRLRARLGLNQTRLGELLGVGTSTVSRWESGQLKPTLTLWGRMAEAEEHGIDALAREESEFLPVAGIDALYSQPPPLDFGADPDIVRVVAEAHRLTYGHLFNPAFAAEVSLVEPLPHQRIAVYEHMLPLPRIRFLLADDPGAGKTIMSGLLIRELLARRLVRRVLIVPPAGLIGNWKREMRTLFQLPFEIVSGSDARTSNPFVSDESDLIIASLDTLAGDRMFSRLQEPIVKPYDIVFFDEAHKLSAIRNADLTIDKTERYKLAEALAGIPTPEPRWSLPWSCHHMVLLTATPHMGRDYPYYALWRLLEPDIFASIEAFHAFPRDARKRYFIRRTKEEMVRFDGSRIYPERVSDTLGCSMSPDEKLLYDRTTEYIRTYYNKARFLNRSAARLAMSVFQRRLTSSTWALVKSFERRIQRLDRLINDIRTGRLSEGELEVRQRKLAGTLPDPLDIKTADEEEGEENERIEDRALEGVVSVNLAELLVEHEQVVKLAELARQVHDSGEESKFERLREVIQDPRFKDEKILIFTEHKDTLDFLVSKLGRIGFAGKVAQIHGSMPYGEEADIERLTERQDNVEFFRRANDQGGATYMVCTDAAAEGINLQFCWLMVNYDIPWNPARLEQRMGRIHRYGQTHDPVHIINLVSDPENTREGRVLKTLLEKLDTIRKSLGKDKVFDVIGKLFEGKTLTEYMEEVVLHGKTVEAESALDTKVTKERIQAIVLEEHKRFGSSDEVQRELPKLKAQLEVEERRRLLPGYVRRFVEKAMPLVDIGVNGSLDDVFSLKSQKARALDPLLPVMETYPVEKRNRFCLRKPRDRDNAVYFHPGEPVFDRLRTWVVDRFEPHTRRGGVFLDPHASEPYAFHMALVTVRRRGDPALAALSRPEIIESRLVGLTQNGNIAACPVEYLLLLRGGQGVPASAHEAVAEAAAGLPAATAFLREEIGREIVERHRRRLEESVPARETYLRQGYDYQEADLAAARAKLREKVRAGDSNAEREVARIRERQEKLHARRDEALAVLQREPALIEVGDVEFLAHALVLPSADPRDKRRQDAEIEHVAMLVARAYEEAADSRVVDVHTPELARAAGLADYPGFDLLSLRLGEERDIEVKGRAYVGEVELSENEWARAATLRERYWLYVVFDCATDRPRLHVVRDPFGKLLLRGHTGVIVAADEIVRHSEAKEGGFMASNPRPETPISPRHPLLALVDKWRTEPGDYDERVGRELDDLLEEDRVWLREPEVLDEDEESDT
jgi:superfamily II DNA or RNA helicase/transcriptional regulator with XRE-family HTH domain